MAFSLNRLLSVDNNQLQGGEALKFSDDQEVDFDSLHLESAAQEEEEAQKILTKRQRRVGKVEDIDVDIDALIKRKKRFKPSFNYESGV